MCEGLASKDAEDAKGRRERKEWKGSGSCERRADSEWGGRRQSKAVEGSRGMLTGRERCWRGVRYFLAVFGVGVAFVTFFFSAATFSPGVDRLPMFLFFVALFCFVPALVVGLGIMACRERKRWHWVVWGGIAILVALVVATLG